MGCVPQTILQLSYLLKVNRMHTAFMRRAHMGMHFACYSARKLAALQLFKLWWLITYSRAAMNEILGPHSNMYLYFLCMFCLEYIKKNTSLLFWFCFYGPKTATFKGTDSKYDQNLPQKVNLCNIVAIIVNINSVAACRHEPKTHFNVSGCLF